MLDHHCYYGPLLRRSCLPDYSGLHSPEGWSTPVADLRDRPETALCRWSTNALAFGGSLTRRECVRLQLRRWPSHPLLPGHAATRCAPTVPLAPDATSIPAGAPAAPGPAMIVPVRRDILQNCGAGATRTATWISTPPPASSVREQRCREIPAAAQKSVPGGKAS